MIQKGWFPAEPGNGNMYFDVEGSDVEVELHPTEEEVKLRYEYIDGPFPKINVLWENPHGNFIPVDYLITQK